MKKFLTLAMALLLTHMLWAQRVITEGIIQYNVTLVKGGENASVASAFNGATQTLLLKSGKARLDFKSPLRSQSTIYDAQTGNGFILKQSGNEKYLLELVGANWKKYHKKYDGVVFAKEETMKQIAGYNCKKATGKMADGSTVVAYYCPDLTVMATGFDPLFGSLSGIVLEYEISNPNGVTVNYQAQSVQMTMVNAAQFEMPKSGVKVLTFEQ
jgi:GLPGLI family protein